MKIFKIPGVLLICMSLFITVGCGKTEGGNSADSASTSYQQSEQILQEGFAITDSENIQGWKTLHAEVALMRLGEENSFQGPSEDDVDKDKKLKYSIDFPGDWTLKYTVFYNTDNEKIAELPPAVLLKSGQETAFLDYKAMIDFGEELISEEETQLNSYKGTKTVTKMPTESGNWYPHIYRISDGTYGFNMNLYSMEISKEDQELFERIVNTFRIEQ